MSIPPTSFAIALDEDQAALRMAAELAGTALCTIVGIDGSFSRRLGAQLAIAPDGQIAGSLSDGCLERELAGQAEAARVDGRSMLLRYGRGSPFIDFRLPCGSGLDVLVEPAPDRGALAALVARLDAREAAELVLRCGRSDLLQVRRYVPSPRLVVLGAGPEPRHLVDLARCHGMIAELRAPDSGLSLGRVPEDLAVDAWTAVVVLFHDHEWEAALLDWALGTQAFYIGAQGGAEARHNRIETLRSRGHGEDAVARLRSPIGMIPRARDARTLALSILAEVVGAFEPLRP